MGNVRQVRRATLAEPYEYAEEEIMRRQKQAVYREFRAELSGPALEEAWQKESIAHHETGLARDAAKTKVSRGREQKKDYSDAFISVESLSRMSIIELSSLTGMPGFECWREFYNILNIDGNADNLLYFGDAEAAGGTERSMQRRRRKHKLEAESSLLFTLFTLRTGSPVAVASVLFGLSSPVGTMCLATWVNFLWRSSKVFVRLPSPQEVIENAPDSFVRCGLQKVVLVLHGTETETERHWHTNLAHVLWSPCKQRPTAKLLVGITAWGNISFVSEAFGGHLSDAEIVLRSGLIERLEKLGLCGKGYSIMVDRGFNPLGLDLVLKGMTLVGPSTLRKGEAQFSKEELQVSYDVARLRVHVERAIGTMKQWRFMTGNIPFRKLDLLGMAVRAIAAVVNLTNAGFLSRTHVSHGGRQREVEGSEPWNEYPHDEEC